MDTKFIRKYGEDILCYRIRTARQKIRMQYEDFDKFLIQLHKEELDLHEKKRNLGWELLCPPVQKGWKRFFVLRGDIERSKQADFFKGILAKINTYDWSSTKDFKIKKRKRGRKTYFVKSQKLLEPGEFHFQKMNFSQAEKQMFHPVLRYEKWSKGLVMNYVFNEPWRFVLRVRPNMIDRVRIKDSAIESRLHEISDFLERNDYRMKQTKILNGDCSHGWYEGEKTKEKYYLKNKSIQQIMDETRQE